MARRSVICSAGGRVKADKKQQATQVSREGRKGRGFFGLGDDNRIRCPANRHSRTIELEQAHPHRVAEPRKIIAEENSEEWTVAGKAGGKKTKLWGVYMRGKKERKR